MEEKFVPEIHGYLRKFMLTVPKVISEASGIRIFGKRIKSLVFSTDVSIIRNCNADAVIAVYPFTPQPVITQAVIMAADVPVFVGIGGGLTQGIRVLDLGLHAEFQGAIGVVVNAPTSNSTVKQLKEDLDIPIVVTVVSEKEDIAARLEAGAQILNVSAAAKTPELVRKIREQFPKVPIIATGGPTDETILETIRAGANAITWTPPSSGEVFKDIMEAYRRQEGHPPF
ncbi:MAG TPA: hydrolase [Clostridiales bacterium]|nr:hydrolase [Clostridiales bacterium]HPU67144.1 hydrolase [Clostridiales bacterium]HQA05992.1 hydrolase [Clostridiales bacterium]HQD71809.1 hydrolase [Clostridiales bacterium]HXK82849.1 hydrolase [Clostridiales bacterium]